MKNVHAPVNIDEFIALAEVARLLKLSRRTVREHLAREGVPVFLLSPKRNAAVRFKKHDVEQWLERCRNRQKVLEDVSGDRLNELPPNG